MEKTYFEQREIDTIEKLRMVKKDLPVVCNEFFIGIEHTTSPLTRLGYALDLRIFFDYLTKEIDYFVGKNVLTLSYEDFEHIESFHIEMFLDYLTYYKIDNKEYKNTIKTKSRKLSSLKSFFKFCYDKDRIKKDPASKVKSPKIHEKPIIRFDNEEVSEFLDTVESGKGLTGHAQAFHNRTKERDTAIMTLFLGTGIRISELVGLDVDDIDFDKKAFKVTRKGGNQTILYFNDEVLDALLKYMDVRALNPALDDEPALFCSLKNKRIDVRSVQILVKKYSNLSTPLKHITPHKLRTTFGTSLYQNTKDIYVVAEVLGHKDVNTTKKHYAAISENIKKEAIEHVNLRDHNKDE